MHGQLALSRLSSVFTLIFTDFGSVQENGDLVGMRQFQVHFNQNRMKCEKKDKGIEERRHQITREGEDAQPTLFPLVLPKASPSMVMAAA